MAQSKIYQLFANKLFGLCLKYSKNKQDAEDVLQDSFITAFKKIGQFNNQGSFEGWLKRITINTALQKHRDKSPLYLVSEEIEEPQEVSINEDLVDLKVLLAFIQELPNRYRLIFNLYTLDNFTHKEIAKMLDISEGTSKSNLSRARLLLKEKVEHYQLLKEKA